MHCVHFSGSLHRLTSRSCRDGDGRPDSRPCHGAGRKTAPRSHGRPGERHHGLPPAGHDRSGRRVPPLQRPGQPLSPDRQRPGLQPLSRGRGRQGGRAARTGHHAEHCRGPGVGDCRGREGARRTRDRRPFDAHRHRQVADPQVGGRDARPRVRVDRDLDARLLAGRERALPLPGRPLPAASRDRRPADRRPDRHHVLELPRSRRRREHNDRHGRHPRRVRREGERRHQPDDALGPRHERREGRGVGGRRALQYRIRLRLRGWRRQPVRVVRRPRRVTIGPLPRSGVLRQLPQHGQLAAGVPAPRRCLGGRFQQLASDRKHRTHAS